MFVTGAGFKKNNNKKICVCSEALCTVLRVCHQMGAAEPAGQGW